MIPDVVPRAATHGNLNERATAILRELLWALSPTARRNLRDEHWARLEQQAEAEAEAEAIEHFDSFVRQAWSLVEPRYRLEWAPYFAILCAELEAVARGDVRELVVCLPPGVSKSLILSALFQPWIWLRNPAERILTVANVDENASRDSRRTRDVIRSPWYQRLVARTGKRDRDGKPWSFAKDQNERVNFVNTMGGQRYAAGITSQGITGKRVDGLIVDDPIDAKQAQGGAAEVAERMRLVQENYDTVLKNRVDAVRGWKVVCMQRLDEADLAGMRIAAGARAVVLPMEGDPDRPDRHPDDVRAKGELLHPRFAEINAEAHATGSRYYVAQYDQRPQSATGSTFKRKHLRWYDSDPSKLAVDFVGISVDCAFKGEAESDRVSIQVWGRHLLDRFLLDNDTRNMDVAETMRALVAMHAKWERTHTIGVALVEDKANGPAILTLLKQSVPKLVPFTPKDSKEARAQLAAVDFEAGHVYLPTAQWCPWAGDYERELLAFPVGHDDQVDATSQMLLYWDQGKGDVAARQLRGIMGALG